MSQSSTNTRTGGIGFLGLLTIVFITLKLIGVITWSWLWVLSPLWIPVVLILGWMGFFVGAAAIITMIDNRKSKKAK